MKNFTPAQSTHESKRKLLVAAWHVMRRKGYAATTIDDICDRAGVTKGSFFHHFNSKEELAVGATHFWRDWTNDLFAVAPYHLHADPRDRVLGYVDFRSTLLTGEIADYTCLLGTLVQETYLTHEAIRIACGEALDSHLEILARDIEMAKQRYAPDASWTSMEIAFYIQSVLQGSFIFAKATQSPSAARKNLKHLRRYLELLFDNSLTD